MELVVGDDAPRPRALRHRKRDCESYTYDAHESATPHISPPSLTFSSRSRTGIGNVAVPDGKARDQPPRATVCVTHASSAPAGLWSVRRWCPVASRDPRSVVSQRWSWGESASIVRAHPNSTAASRDSAPRYRRQMSSQFDRNGGRELIGPLGIRPIDAQRGLDGGRPCHEVGLMLLEVARRIRKGPEVRDDELGRAPCTNAGRADHPAVNIDVGGWRDWQDIQLAGEALPGRVTDKSHA